MSALKAAGIALGVWGVAVVVTLVITVTGVGVSSHMGAAQAGRLLVTLVGMQLAIFGLAGVALGLALRAAGIQVGGTVLTLVLYAVVALLTAATLAFVTTVMLNR